MIKPYETLSDAFDDIRNAAKEAAELIHNMQAYDARNVLLKAEKRVRLWESQQEDDTARRKANDEAYERMMQRIQ